MGRTVLITGASGGLGASLARAFSKKGYSLIITGRDKERLEKTKKEAEKNNVICDAVIGELRDLDTINKLSKLAEERDIDILINNAGVCYKSDFLDLTNEQISETIRIDLEAPILLARSVFSIFVKKSSGIIVNISSIDGFSPSRQGGAYNAAKYGLKGFTDSLRLEAREKGIRVIGVYPGGMISEMYKRVKGDINPQKCMRTDDVASKIFMACEDESSSRIDDIVLRR